MAAPTTRSVWLRVSRRWTAATGTIPSGADVSGLVITHRNP